MADVWCVDLNETISAYPDQMRKLMEGLRSGGDEVHVLSGWKAESADADALDHKRQQLEELGCGSGPGADGASYDRLVVVADPENHVADQKVAYMRHVGATGLIDNNRKNCKKAVKAGFLALRPQGTPTK